MFGNVDMSTLPNIYSFTSGMHNIRPAEAFNLARETPIWFILLLPFIKTPFECVKTYQLWPLDMPKKIFWPAMRFELCTPVLHEQRTVALTRELFVFTASNFVKSNRNEKNLTTTIDK